MISYISNYSSVPIRCGHIQLKIIWRCEAHLTFPTGEPALMPIVTIRSISNNNSLSANYRPKILKFSYYYYGPWSPIYLITTPFLFDVELLGCQSIYVNRLFCRNTYARAPFFCFNNYLSYVTMFGTWRQRMLRRNTQNCIPNGEKILLIFMSKVFILYEGCGELQEKLGKKFCSHRYVLVTLPNSFWRLLIASRAYKYFFVYLKKKKNQGESFLVVTHKSILRALICTALGLGPER